MPRKADSSIIIKKTKKGTSIEFRNINMKPEELHAIVESSKESGGRSNGNMYNGR